MNDALAIPCGNAEIERAEAVLLKLPQVECPLVHRFAPGVYYREITMPAGSLIIGHEHKTEHFNVVTKGRALVLMDGVRHEIVAPCVFPSAAGVRKVLFIQEEMVWATIHPTHETNLDRLADELITKSPTWLEHAQREALQLNNEMKGET